MLDALTVLPLLLLIVITLFITVFLHELGHAIPALLVTERYQDVTIYIGSIGDANKSFHFTIGRLIVYCKYNPLLWYRGCCVFSDYNLSIDQKLLCTAGGPLVSILCTIGGWYLLMAVQQEGFLRVLVGGIFTVSLLIAVAFLIPDPRPRYTPSGLTVYTDSYQVFRLLKMKFT